MSIRKSALPALLAALLAGCSATGFYRLENGKSSEAEVRQSLGTPARVYDDPDGSRQLAFPRGPEGTQTYMAFIGPDGKLARLEQVLTEEQFRRIEQGRTTTAQLERLIGPPSRKVEFANLGQVAWDYVYQDTWGYIADFSAMVDGKGVVVSTISVRRDFGRGRTG